MPYLRKKSMSSIHQRFESLTEGWNYDQRQTPLSDYLLKFGVLHMMMLDHHLQAAERLGDILFSGAYLDWCYQRKQDDFAPLMLIWRALGIEQSKYFYVKAMRKLHIQNPAHFSIVRQVVEFVRDAYGKSIAVEVATLSKEAHQKHLDKESYDLSESYRQLALSLKSNGSAEEGLPFMREALDIQRRLLSIENPSLYVSVNSLASMLNTLKKYEESEALFVEAMENRTRLLGEEHPKTLISIASYAFLLNKTKQYKKAHDYQKKVYQLRRKILGFKHTKTLISCYHYGVCLRELGYLTKSMDMFQVCYQYRMELLGEEHRMTNNAQKALLGVQIRLQKALQKFPKEQSPFDI